MPKRKSPPLKWAEDRVTEEVEDTAENQTRQTRTRRSGAGSKGNENHQGTEAAKDTPPARATAAKRASTGRKNGNNPTSKKMDEGEPAKASPSLAVSAPSAKKVDAGESSDEELPTLAEILGTPSTVRSLGTSQSQQSYTSMGLEMASDSLSARKASQGSSFNAPGLNQPMSSSSGSADSDEDMFAPKVGEAVLARYKGSNDKRYYPCQIEKIEGQGKYVGRYWDGAVRKMDRRDFFTIWDSAFHSCRLAQIPESFLKSSGHNEDYEDEDLSARITELLPELVAVLSPESYKPPKKKCERLKLFEDGGRKNERRLLQLQSAGAFSNDQTELFVRTLLAHLEKPGVHPDRQYKKWEQRRKDKLVRSVLLPEFCKLDMMRMKAEDAKASGMTEEEAEAKLKGDGAVASVETGTAWIEKLLATRTLYAEV